MAMEKGLLWTAIGLLAAAVVWAACRYAYFYRKEHFTCPHCGHCWKPPLLRMIFSVNAVEGKILTCPCCGPKEYMEPEKDS